MLMAVRLCPDLDLPTMDSKEGLVRCRNTATRDGEQTGSLIKELKGKTKQNNKRKRKQSEEEEEEGEQEGGWAEGPGR